MSPWVEMWGRDRRPAELWRSGNPWQCDFCFSLCIKSRCQEPSPKQRDQRPGLHLSALYRPPHYYIVFGLQMLLFRSSCGTPVTWRKKKKVRERGDFRSIISLCKTKPSYQTSQCFDDNIWCTLEHSSKPCIGRWRNVMCVTEKSHLWDKIKKTKKKTLRAFCCSDQQEAADVESSWNMQSQLPAQLF